ncbi:MAG: hypothetical protein HXN17_08460, partial [Porphyromonas sp.]|uniref:hypothetical protein n=1 Tax=Porphyromonas sp. TaxID=1924944 RepID=UPI001CAD2320
MQLIEPTRVFKPVTIDKDKEAVIPLGIEQSLTARIAEASTRTIRSEVNGFIFWENFFSAILYISPGAYQARIPLFLREVRGFLFAGDKPDTEGQQEQK